MNSICCRNIRLMFVDFDKTCTTHDTTGLLYKATKTYQGSNLSTRAKLDERWSRLAEMYIKGYLDLMQTVEPTSTVTKLDKEGLETFLRSLSDFDKRITKQVEASEILMGIDEEGIRKVSKHIQMYDGCKELLRKMDPLVRIVSLNWSSYMLSLCLEGDVDKNHILANTFDMTNGVSSGKLTKKVGDAFDKQNIVQSEMMKNRNSGITVFIGDSPSDFLAMLSTDIGILIGNSNSAQKVARKFGIIIEPLEYLSRGGFDFSRTSSFSSSKNVIFQVSSWKEIDQFFTQK